MPKISVIMPVYNGEKYLREAIDSILAQTYTDFEFIIIDDGSADTSQQIVRSYTDPRIRFYQNEHNMGVAATLNRGLDLAAGEYIARMDADDISLPTRFEFQVDFLDKHLHTAVVGCEVYFFDENGFIRNGGYSSNFRQMKVDLFFFCGLAHPSVMMRKSMVRRVGGYDLSFNGLEDYELWSRISDSYEITAIPHVLFKYRIHGSQVTKNPSPDYLRRMHCLKERQLIRIGIDPKCDAARAYYDYCLGEPVDTFPKVELLSEFAELAIFENNKHYYYSAELLKNDLKSILVRNISELSVKQQKDLCKRSTIISYQDVQKYMLKKTIKRWIGRQ